MVPTLGLEAQDEKKGLMFDGEVAILRKENGLCEGD